jgi:hypothetical protein
MSNSKGDSLGEGLGSLRIGAICLQFRTQRVNKLSKTASPQPATAGRVCGLRQGSATANLRRAGRYRWIRGDDMRLPLDTGHERIPRSGLR